MKKLKFLPLIVAVVTGMLLMTACKKCVNCEIGNLLVLEESYKTYNTSNYEIKALFLQPQNPHDTIVRYITGKIPNNFQNRLDTIPVRIDLRMVYPPKYRRICLGCFPVYKIKYIEEL